MKRTFAIVVLAETLSCAQDETDRTALSVRNVD